MNSPDSKLQSVPAAKRKLRIIAIIFFLAIALVFLLCARRGYTYLRAAGLLLRMENPQHAGWLGGVHTYPIAESLTQIRTPTGSVRARLYMPQGIANEPGMLVVHGVHHLGIDEPRLVAFARALSSSGIEVLTPELPALADYHVDPHSIDIIGSSARDFAQSTGHKVGVLGISFGGGLALMAAANPHYDRFIRFVVSVGAHENLERVSRFFIKNQITRPDGSILHMAAHEYGPLVLIYSHVEDFFPAADVVTAREALRLLLWEEVDESRKVAEKLSPASRAKMELLYSHHIEPLSDEIEQVIVQHRADMAAVSPHARLWALDVPALLLHGSADNVIPPSELLWLEQDVPPGDLKVAVISPVLSHVSMEGKPSLIDNLRLVNFMAKMLELVDDQQRSPPKPRT
ncbi:MAG: alpha/beta fold hydrolase [Terriglobales bacterium]